MKCCDGCVRGGLNLAHRIAALSCQGQHRRGWSRFGHKTKSPAASVGVFGSVRLIPHPILLVAMGVRSGRAKLGELV